MGMSSEQEIPNGVPRIERVKPAAAIDGGEIEVSAESICVHGDTKGAVDMARELRIGFEKATVKLVSLRDLV